MSLKNKDNSQFAIVRASGQQAGLVEGHGAYPTLDDAGRLVVVTLTGGTLLTGPNYLYKRTGNFYGVLVTNPCYLFQAWGSINPLAAVQNWVHFFNSTADPPAGTPYIPALPLEPGGAMWSVSFPEGLYFSTGLTIGYSQTYGSWLQAAQGGQFAALVKFP